MNPNLTLEAGVRRAMRRLHGVAALARERDDPELRGVAQIIFDAIDDLQPTAGCLEARMGLIEELRGVCAEAHRFASAIGAPARVLDNLSAAAEGRALPHATFLPTTAEEGER
jgi:hypothetical protein